jgi:putative spermidine/putrescine transport system ATP-binding protein
MTVIEQADPARDVFQRPKTLCCAVKAAANVITLPEDISQSAQPLSPSPLPQKGRLDAQVTAVEYQGICIAVAHYRRPGKSGDGAPEAEYFTTRITPATKLVCIGTQKPSPTVQSRRYHRQGDYALTKFTSRTGLSRRAR